MTRGSSQTCILVLGMHRSGPSAMTRMLGLVLASHSDQVLERHCNLIVTLEHGEIVGMDRVAA